MKVRVTQSGLLIPKSLLEDCDEVEIRCEERKITIIPLDSDPIRRLGQTPLEVCETDASEYHDDYLYRS
ncbi:MAG: hypothetical protein HC808_12425 [Candidatus Competibacteraceae bacterium]|nr:hypothetical protein [Candidatus Competibacteraceae bacterium]